jgi:hypothetical protein
MRRESAANSPSHSAALTRNHVGQAATQVVPWTEQRTPVKELHRLPSNMVAVRDNPNTGLWRVDALAMPLYIAVPKCVATYFQTLDEQSFYNLHLHKGYHQRFFPEGFSIYKDASDAMDSEEVYRVISYTENDE